MKNKNYHGIGTLVEANQKNIECFSITEFVTVNFVKDWINGIRNMLGLEQKSYSAVVNNKMTELFKKIEENGKIIWFRQEITEGFDKSIQITIYGQIQVK